jgi:iron complex transport system ATP-binding protein
MTAIDVSQVSFDYAGRPVLTGISLNILAGERVAILGPNGVGKSTLLKVMSGTLRPKAGTVLLNGRDLRSISRQEMARKIGVVPQEMAIPFAFTAREIVELGRTPHVGMLQGFRTNDRRAVEQAMELTDTSSLAGRVINELSGGERQRVIIAMALAQEPEILLFDEPTHLLDITRQAEILNLVSALNHQRGLTIVAAIHDLNLASRYFHRLVVLHQGTVLAEGSPQSVLQREVIEKAYSGPVEIVQTEDGQLPIVLPACRPGGTNSTDDSGVKGSPQA